MPEELQTDLPPLKSGLTGEFRPERHATGAQKEEYKRELEETQTFGEAVGLGVDNQWITSSLERGMQRLNVWEPVQGYAPPEEELEEYREEFNNDGREYLRRSRSPEEFAERAAHLREDIGRHKELAAYGLQGVGAELIAGVLDPVGWGVGILTGGIGAAAKVGRIGRAVKTGLAVAAEGAAFETALALTDTQRDLDDVLMAAGSSLVLGSGIGFISRGRPELSGVVAAADNMDSVVAKTSQDALAADRLTTRQANIHGPSEAAEVTIREQRISLDGPTVDAGLAKHKLTLEASARPFRDVQAKTKRAKKKVTKRLLADETRALTGNIKTLRGEIDELEGLRVSHRATVSAGFGAPRNQSEAIRNSARADMIDNLYSHKIESRANSLKVAEDRLSLLNESSAASKELETFDAMTHVEQIRAVFGDNPPKLIEEVSRQVKIMKKTTEGLGEDSPEIVVHRALQEVEKAPVSGEKPVSVEKAEFVGPPQPLFTTGETLTRFTERLINDMADKPTPVSLRYLPRAVADRLQGVFTTIDNSPNLAFRGLGHILFESPQGGFKPKDTAGILSAVHEKKIKFAVRNRYNEGFDGWSASQGRGRVVSALDKGRWRADFNRDVYLAILNPKRATDANIRHAAEGMKDGFSEALRLRKAAGELGFELVEDTGKYAPIIFDNVSMLRSVNKHSKEDVLSALSKGYQTGKFKLKASQADKLAKMQYVRTMESIPSQKHAFESAVSQSERQRFLQEMRDAGVPDNVIADFLDEKELKELLDNVSNRSKRSMGINPEASVLTPSGELSVHELLNTNVAELGETYFREASGGAAMATHGFGTYNQALQVVDAAERYGLNMGHDIIRTNTEAQMLRDGINMIYGKSIELNPKGGVEVATRRAREFTTLIRLQMMGFPQITEPARALVELGVATNLKQIPALGIFRRKAKRKGGKSSGDIDEPTLREMEHLTGYVGESNWEAPIILRQDDFGEGAAGGEMARMYDNAVAYGLKLNTIMSGFQATQGGAEKMVAKSIHYRLREMLDGTRSMDTRTMNEIGWDDDFIKQMQEFYTKNPKFDEFEGRQIRLLNVAGMSPEMQMKLNIGSTRLAGRLIQRQFIGDTSPWMSKWLGKSLSQFKTFGIVSGEKQLIHDLKGDKIKAAQILAWSTFLGTISYSSKVHLNAIGEKDPANYIEERMSQRNLSYGVFNMLPQTGIISLGGDFLATLGALPDDMYAAPGKGGVRPMSPENIAPIMGTAANVLDLANSTVGLLTGDAEGPKTAEKARRLMPVLQSIGVGQIVKRGIGSFEE